MKNFCMILIILIFVRFSKLRKKVPKNTILRSKKISELKKLFLSKIPSMKIVIIAVGYPMKHPIHNLISPQLTVCPLKFSHSG